MLPGQQKKPVMQVKLVAFPVMQRITFLTQKSKDGGSKTLCKTPGCRRGNALENAQDTPRAGTGAGGPGDLKNGLWRFWLKNFLYE
jgi:hypothetical protein